MSHKNNSKTSSKIGDAVFYVWIEANNVVKCASGTAMDQVRGGIWDGVGGIDITALWSRQTLTDTVPMQHTEN